VVDGVNEQTVWVQTPRRVEWCRACGRRARSNDRPVTQLRHLPSATGKATRVVWVKREWRAGPAAGPGARPTSWSGRGR
jgi:hypothetical protein